MRLPNGFGSVYKLSGNRRNPWCARKTTGWTFDQDKKKSYPIYQFIGYFPTRKAALLALTEYNKDPFDLQCNTITFGELYEKWSKEHFEKISHGNASGYITSYKLCNSIKNLPIKDINLDLLQKVVNESGKGKSALIKLKLLFSNVFEYALRHEIIDQQKRNITKYVDISNATTLKPITRKPFSKDEISTLWKVSESNINVSTILVLIYTGLRIGELLNLKKEDLHLEERYIYIRKSKTSNGIRNVPIAEKIVPFLESMIKHDSDYVIAAPNNEPMIYNTYIYKYWSQFAGSHRPHDTRHTCISLLTAAGVDERIIKKIVGHSGKSITETVYTHFEISDLIKEINKI